MRIVGCSFTGQPGPVIEGYMRLADITALLGPNDSGKSRLLATFVAAVEGVIDAEAQAAAATSTAVYAELDDAEFAWVTSRGWGSLSEEARATVDFVRPDSPRLRPAEPGLPAKLSKLSPDAATQLKSSRVVAFSRGTETYWRTWLCLREMPEAAEDRQLLDEFTALPARALYELFQKRTAAAAPPCLLDPDAPPVVVELSGAEAGALPEPIRVPTTATTLVAELASAVDRIMSNLAWAESESDELDFSDADGWSDAQAQTAYDAIRDSYRAWLSDPAARRDLWYQSTDSGRGLRRRRELDRLVARASRLATQALPSFVAQRYDIAISIPSAADWTASAPMEIGLLPREGSGRFSLDAAADGVQLWIQLALLEAVRDLRRWPTRLAAAIDALGEDVRYMSEIAAQSTEEKDALSELDPEDDEEAYAIAQSDLQDSLHGLKAIREAIASFANEARLALVGAFRMPRRPRESAAGRSLDRPRALRPPLYVLDEPERYLHPRLQRAAAHWLGEFADKEDVQVIVATHSVPFTRLQGQTTIYVERNGSISTAQNLMPEQLDAINEITRELGLDRGELLASISLFLFVEGESDRLVLESLFGVRLRAAGVAVIPIGGVTKSGAVLDAEMLLRWSSAEICVMFDDLAELELAELTAMNDRDLSTASRKGKAERQYMARLIWKARQLGRPMHVEGIPVHDIFDLLDDKALRVVFPKWTGHARAHAAFLGQRQETRVKFFRELEYDIPLNEVFWYAQVADLMRTRPPAALVRVVRSLERIASAARL